VTLNLFANESDAKKTISLKNTLLTVSLERFI